MVIQDFKPKFDVCGQDNVLVTSSLFWGTSYQLLPCQDSMQKNLILIGLELLFKNVFNLFTVYTEYVKREV
jgi:hypothetical protein